MEELLVSLARKTRTIHLHLGSNDVMSCAGESGLMVMFRISLTVMKRFE